jgi:hypothetical protein
VSNASTDDEIGSAVGAVVGAGARDRLAAQQVVVHPDPVEPQFLGPAGARDHVRPGAAGEQQRIREARAGRHLCTNAVFQVDGDTASGLSDFLFVGLDADAPQVGRYADSYRREDGRWRIAARRTLLAQA